MSQVTPRGRFVTFEGIEGAGKSTVVRAAVAHLQARGRDAMATREPGGTPLAERVRAIVLDRDREPVPTSAELLLMFAARALHVANLIEPALRRGQWVLCDRFTDATRAYQGGGRGVADADIETLAQLAHPGLAPDLTLLLDLPPALGLARARGRQDGGDRFEDEALAFFERVRTRYLSLAAAQPARWRVIDAAAPLPQVIDQVHQALDALRAPP